MSNAIKVTALLPNKITKKQKQNKADLLHILKICYIVKLSFQGVKCFGKFIYVECEWEFNPQRLYKGLVMHSQNVNRQKLQNYLEENGNYM